MTKRKTTPTNVLYDTITGITNDSLDVRYGPGEIVDLSQWTPDQVEWLLSKGSIRVHVPDTKELPTLYEIENVD